MMVDVGSFLTPHSRRSSSVTGFSFFLAELMNNELSKIKIYRKMKYNIVFEKSKEKKENVRACDHYPIRCMHFVRRRREYDSDGFSVILSF